MPFASDAFDYAALIITLCFVKDPGKVIEEAYRIIKKDGRIIIGIIDKESFLGKFYRSKNSPFYKPARFMGVKETTALLENAGFAGFSYYQTIFSLPGAMDSVEKPRKGFGRGGFVVISGNKQ